MDDNIARLAELHSQGDGKRPKQADVLIALADVAVLFHSPAPDCDAFADITVNGHRETHRIRGQGFRQWLRHQFFRKTKTGANSDALQVATETIAAKAMFEGDEHEVHCRIAEHGGTIYIDIGDKDWIAIKVTAAGWDIVADPPVRFLRAPSMRPLPVPARGGSIELLRPFCNLSQDGFTLFVAVLLAGLRPQSNYPVAVLTGEQGTGKSSLVRLLARLIDPRMPEQRSTPRTEEDLLVAAKGQHFLSFDNVSGLPDWLSDAICRLSTGGGAGKRRLYTDEDEVLFSGRRLVAINGIEDVAVRPDLVDRAVMLALEPIAEKQRRDEAEYNAEFARIAPKVLGALLDGAVSRPPGSLTSPAWLISRCGRRPALGRIGQPGHFWRHTVPTWRPRLTWCWRRARSGRRCSSSWPIAPHGKEPRAHYCPCSRVSSPSRPPERNPGPSGPTFSAASCAG